MSDLLAFWEQHQSLLLKGTQDTLIMVLVATLFSYLIGGVLGIVLCVVSPRGLHPHKGLAAVLGWIVNIGRSIPFIVLMLFLLPATRAVMGTGLGIPGAIFPLLVSAAPFVARVVEQSLLEVDTNLVEAAQAMGANHVEIICKVYLREALPSLLRGLPIVAITILGYTAMAGAVGAGGLGDIAYRFGYQRYQNDIMLATVVILLILVQLMQSLGDVLVRVFDKRMRS